MDEKQAYKDTGKLTNYHYGTDEDNRTTEEQTQLAMSQDKPVTHKPGNGMPSMDNRPRQ
ncbi:hypothetical protein [Ectobacillus ponti]|uniref:Uncharacterized protein n=1 Tax=Ectobacillus ponti TaxID=2961894 RepID=A0AA41X7L1_9BACI|nr:hypothetical protein [Ectobacillus ponti]MCP8968658.1 hypothetical protein [Ectobacillus ponti]